MEDGRIDGREGGPDKEKNSSRGIDGKEDRHSVSVAKSENEKGKR